MFSRILLFGLLISLAIVLPGSRSAFGQKNARVHFIFQGSSQEDAAFIKNEFKEFKSIRDTSEATSAINTVLDDLKDLGFITAGVDSIRKDTLVTTAYIYSGEKFSWGYLRKGNVADEFLVGTGFRKKLVDGKPFRYAQVNLLLQKIIRNCENNGYPFASVRLDSVSIKDNIFSASLFLEKERLVHIDSISIKGTASIVPVYIYDYTGIRPGDIYNESQIKRITSRMRELPFVKEVRGSQVLFTDRDTRLYLFLENRKASQFDGVLGLLPDESKQGKINLTGEVHLKLQNSLRRGEVIELNWKQLPVKSQDLKVHALYPYVLNTPFGLDGNLAIFKKDTTYIDVTKNLGVQYSFTGNNFLRAFLNDKQSDLQTTKGLENITVLPAFADITTVSYGLTIHIEKLDYRLNPRKGFAAEATGSTGNRTIRKNGDINPLVYENITLKTVTYQGEISADYYFSPGGRHVIDLGTRSAYIYNPDLFVNELYRIGGLRSLRGFDEESIYASVYTIGKLEYRYLLEQNSFLFAFFNMAWYENRSREIYLTDTPLGFGAGINFDTKIGIMSVSYALGKQFDNPIFFRNGKVHFGIVNYF